MTLSEVYLRKQPAPIPGLLFLSPLRGRMPGVALGGKAGGIKR